MSETDVTAIAERLARLENAVQGLARLAMERRRVALDEVNCIEAALDVAPRTSELRKLDKQSRKGSA